MHRFMLREPYGNEYGGKTWQVIMLGDPVVLIAEFVGVDEKGFLDNDVAPLVAGDYVEMLNEKYLDKNINEEWPPKDEEKYLDYHLNKAKKLARKLGHHEIAHIIKQIDKGIIG